MLLLASPSMAFLDSKPIRLLVSEEKLKHQHARARLVKRVTETLVMLYDFAEGVNELAVALEMWATGNIPKLVTGTVLVVGCRKSDQNPWGWEYTSMSEADIECIEGLHRNRLFNLVASSAL